VTRTSHRPTARSWREVSSALITRCGGGGDDNFASESILPVLHVHGYQCQTPPTAATNLKTSKDSRWTTSARHRRARARRPLPYSAQCATSRRSGHCSYLGIGASLARAEAGEITLRGGRQMACQPCYSHRYGLSLASRGTYIGRAGGQACKRGLRVEFDHRPPPPTLPLPHRGTHNG
jgi:hypothetical protein